MRKERNEYILLTDVLSVVDCIDLAAKVTTDLLIYCRYCLS